LVERSSSSVIFLSSRTSTFAVKIVKTMFDECVSKRLVDSLGATVAGVGVSCGIEDALNSLDCGEKNPLVSS
jgi:hypothetical protein